MPVHIVALSLDTERMIEVLVHMDDYGHHALQHIGFQELAVREERIATDQSVLNQTTKLFESVFALHGLSLPEKLTLQQKQDRWQSIRNGTYQPQQINVEIK